MKNTDTPSHFITGGFLCLYQYILPRLLRIDLKRETVIFFLNCSFRSLHCFVTGFVHFTSNLVLVIEFPGGGSHVRSELINRENKK